MATILLAKANISDIAKELNASALKYEYLCLSKTQKWCNEMLFSLEHVTIPEDSSIVNYSKIFGKDYKVYQLSKSYFNLKEYARAVYYLSKAESQICYFLSVYAKYMSISKKFVDNKSDLFSNSDTSNLDSLQNLRYELKLKYHKTKLDPYSLYIYGTILSKLKLHEEAMQVLVEAVNKEPMLWCAWIELANLIRSIDILNTINQESLPQHWIKDLFLAHCYMELSLSEEALNIYLEYSNKGFEKSIYIKSQIAKCYDILREGQECKQTFEAIRKLDPYNLDYMDIYSNILFVLEEHAQLAILAQEACEIDKYRPESCCIIGNYYSLQNDHHKAVTYFQRALKLNPSYLQAWTLMGHEFMELKNSSAAIQSYTHAITLNPKDYRAWYGLGQTYEILKLYSYSLYYYKQVYLMRPTDSRFIVALADVYVKLEKWDEARRCYIKAYSVGDCEGTALYKLAKIYEKLNDPSNAAVAYDKYTQDQNMMQGGSNSCGTDLSQAYAYLANYYFKKGRLDNAYEKATKCLEFPETRLEAQSLLNQIAQSRSLKEFDSNQCNPESMDQTVNNNNNNNTNMNIQDSDLADASISNLKFTQQKFYSKSNGAAQTGASASSSTATTSSTSTTTITPGGTATTSAVTDSDSETDGTFNDFQIKRFQLRKDI